MSYCVSRTVLRVRLTVGMCRVLCCVRRSTTQPEELCDLYSSPNIIRVIKSRRVRWAGHVARMGIGGEEQESYTHGLVVRLERKKLLRRPKCRWEDNIKMDLQEIGWGHGLD